MKNLFGIDVGTTSVAGVALSESGDLVARTTIDHEAMLPSAVPDVFEQDPARLCATVAAVLDELKCKAGEPEGIGWTGQMHGIVGVDANLRPLTNFVTWRDARRFGGRVMAGWRAQGLRLHKCLPVCALVQSACRIDRTFLHSWYLDEPGLEFPRGWLPETVDGCMLGDNQAGVFAAQHFEPGCAVVNLGTSGQLSVVRDCPFEGPDVPGRTASDGSRLEMRPYPGARTLACRASTVGGAAWAALRAELGISWEEMNVTDDPRVRVCARRIVDDLFGDIDLTGVTGLVGVGNALARNAALRRAVEDRAGCACRLPDWPEMAACGAALHLSRHSSPDGR